MHDLFIVILIHDLLVLPCHDPATALPRMFTRAAETVIVGIVARFVIRLAAMVAVFNMDNFSSFLPPGRSNSPQASALDQVGTCPC